MQTNEHWVSGEPSVDEILADPIVRALMASDGLSEDSVRKTFEEAAKRLRARTERVHEAA